ncbi:MAG: hypothetical protein IJA58_00145 [Lachnospiraceae bacterium]|nr:hypothetical protein [Lachnospiraceae bacterium]
MMRDAFYEKIRLDVQEQLNTGECKVEVTLETVTKHNDVELVGLRVVYEDKPTSPMRYLNREREAYLNGCPYQEILAEICEQIEHASMGEIGKAVDWSYEDIRPHLYIQISELDRNREWIGDKVHEINGDMVLTYHALMDNESMMRCEISITKTLIQSWGITEETVKADARANLDGSEVVVNSLNNVIANEVCPCEVKNLYDLPKEEWETDEPRLYILNNPVRRYGASQILRPEVLSQIGEVLGDYYVLPSSVDEVLLSPKKDALPLSKLSQMVFEINRTETNKTDVLSDQVLYYDHDRELLMNATDYFARELGIPAESIDVALSKEMENSCDRDCPEER